MPSFVSFEIYQGDDKSLYVQVLNEDRSVATLESVANIELLVYNRDEVLLKKTLTDNQIVIISAADGKFKVDFTNQDSKYRVSAYKMIIRLTMQDGKIHTIFSGSYVIKPIM